MARINIEDSIFTDKRFIRFMMALQDECTAIGAFMFACLEAQKYHSLENIRALIPAKDFSEKVSYAAELLSTGVARLEDDHVYIIGAEEQFSWLTDAKTKGKKGGTKTRENRAERLQTEQNKESSPATAQLQPDIAQLPAATAESSPAYPLTPTLPLTLTLTPTPKGLPKTDSTEVWIAYIEAYRDRYGVEPTRNARVNTQMARFVTQVPLKEASAIARFYLGSNLPYYVTRMHPVSILLQDAEKLRTEFLSGKRVTSVDAKQMESGDVMKNQIERMREFYRDQ